MHKSISLKNISLSFSSKKCFEGFSTQIYPMSRIAVIGRNGTGKSSLLNILGGKLFPSGGEVRIPDGVCICHVEQIVSDCNTLSGGEQFNRSLSQSLGKFPDLLLLDEPTNHLDKNNRKSLIQMLKGYRGTFIIATHDTELLGNCFDTLWHIDNNKIVQFTGSYDDYMREIKQKRITIERQLLSLKRSKKDIHSALMREQKRATKSKAKGQKSIDQKKWPTIVSKSKALRAGKTSGNKKSAIHIKKQQLTEQLSDLVLPEVTPPKFLLTAKNTNSKSIISITGADIGYAKDKSILKNINLSLGGRERIAICGKNMSGKSMLLKSILGKEEIFTSGSWVVPCSEHIGYLDQRYSNLRPELSVMEHIKQLRPDWSEIDARRHLNGFLLRKNIEVTQVSSSLSSGEKVRASLSIIAAKTPRLLILDEITNNIDLETKEYVMQALNKYPGAMIVVSHEQDFLKAIAIDHIYTLVKGRMIG